MVEQAVAANRDQRAVISRGQQAVRVFVHLDIVTPVAAL